LPFKNAELYGDEGRAREQLRIGAAAEVDVALRRAGDGDAAGGGISAHAAHVFAAVATEALHPVARRGLGDEARGDRVRLVGGDQTGGGAGAVAAPALEAVAGERGGGERHGHVVGEGLLAALRAVETGGTGDDAAPALHREVDGDAEARGDHRVVVHRQRAVGVGAAAAAFPALEEAALRRSGGEGDRAAARVEQAAVALVFVGGGRDLHRSLTDRGEDHHAASGEHRIAVTPRE
jgi:hypothetical protein